MPLFAKSITFRLSQEEYAELATCCKANKVRSVSDFVRSATLREVRRGRSERDLILEDLLTLGSALSDIDSALKGLSGKISKVLGPSKRTLWTRAARSSD